MKLLTLILTFCITFNALAASGALQELGRNIDEFQFALTVEWDQKDQGFYEEKSKDFLDNLNYLINDKGLKKEDILMLVENRVSDKSALESLKLKLSLMGDVKSSVELARILKDESKNFYRKGASWNGHRSTEVAGGILVALLIGYVIWFDSTHRICTRSESSKLKSDTSIKM